MISFNGRTRRGDLGLMDGVYQFLWCQFSVLSVFYRFIFTWKSRKKRIDFICCSPWQWQWFNHLRCGFNSVGGGGGPEIESIQLTGTYRLGTELNEWRTMSPMRHVLPVVSYHCCRWNRPISRITRTTTNKRATTWHRNEERVPFHSHRIAHFQGLNDSEWTGQLLFPSARHTTCLHISRVTFNI